MKLVEGLSKDLGYPITAEDYQIIDAGCPHKSGILPKGYAAIYMFVHGERVLKIGKANAKSSARFSSQHYGFHARSTLAKSLFSDPDYRVYTLMPEEVGAWIKENCHRYNVLIKESCGKAATELVEAVFHYAFRPKYEGAI